MLRLVGLFTNGLLKVENKENLFDLVVTLYFISLCFNPLRSRKVSQSTFENEMIIISQFAGTSKVCDQNGDRVSITE